jgi:hypothetical protein
MNPLVLIQCVNETDGIKPVNFFFVAVSLICVLQTGPSSNKIIWWINLPLLINQSVHHLGISVVSHVLKHGWLRTRVLWVRLSACDLLCWLFQPEHLCFVLLLSRVTKKRCVWMLYLHHFWPLFYSHWWPGIWLIWRPVKEDAFISSHFSVSRTIWIPAATGNFIKKH